jgi:hypothetical protein
MIVKDIGDSTRISAFFDRELQASNPSQALIIHGWGRLRFRASFGDLHLCF